METKKRKFFLSFWSSVHPAHYNLFLGLWAQVATALRVGPKRPSHHTRSISNGAWVACWASQNNFSAKWQTPRGWDSRMGKRMPDRGNGRLHPANFWDFWKFREVRGQVSHDYAKFLLQLSSYRFWAHDTSRGCTKPAVPCHGSMDLWNHHPASWWGFGQAKPPVLVAWFHMIPHGRNWRHRTCDESMKYSKTVLF